MHEGPWQVAKSELCWHLCAVPAVHGNLPLLLEVKSLCCNLCVLVWTEGALPQLPCPAPFLGPFVQLHRGSVTGNQISGLRHFWFC